MLNAADKVEEVVGARSPPRGCHRGQPIAEIPGCHFLVPTATSSLTVRTIITYT